MNDAELIEKAAVIQSLIDASRARINNREPVDLGLIEAKIAALHKTVSDHTDAGRAGAAAATIDVMENIITDLDSLALEIQSNYRAVSGAAGLAANPYSEG